jgi:hypothetical protein
MLRRVSGFFGQKFAAQGAIDYPIYGLLALSTILTSVLSWWNSDDDSGLPVLVMANVFAVAAVCIVIVAIDRFLKGMGPDLRISLGLLVLVGSALGGIKGLLTWLALVGLGYPAENGRDLLSRVVASGIAGLIVFPAVALFGSLRFRYTQQREALIHEKIASANGENYPATLLRFVADAKVRIARAGNSFEPQRIVSDLRDIVNSDLRPLSQQIWRRESASLPSFKLSQIAKLALRGHVYSIGWVVPLWALTTITATARAFSLEESLGIQLVRALLLIAGMLIAKRIPVKSFAGSLIVYVSAMSLVGLSQVGLGSLLSEGRALGEDLGFAVANLIWLFQLTMFIGMVRAFLELGKKVESEYEKFLDEADIEVMKSSRDRALKDRQLAQFLHGHMQTKLNAVAARIEARQSQGNLSAYIEQIEKVLNDAVMEFGKQQVTDIENVIESLQRDWGGFVKLTFAISPAQLSQKQLEDVKEVVNEGIANAVRHGFASRVSVTLGAGPEITITDDGTGPRDGVPGLGTSYFDSISKDWELRATTAGSILRLKFD